MNSEELPYCHNCQLTFSTDVEASMHSCFQIKKERQEFRDNKGESEDQNQINMYNPDKPASQLVEIKLETGESEEKPPDYDNDNDVHEDIKNNGDAEPPRKKRPYKKKAKKLEDPYYLPPLPSHLFDSYYDLDVSQEFLTTILRYVDDLCNLINNGDPNLARSMEVSENLSKAVTCYRNELLILESKNPDSKESFDTSFEPFEGPTPSTPSSSTKKKRKIYQVITNETFEKVKNQCGIHSGNEMAKILNVHERNLQRKIKQHEAAVADREANPGANPNGNSDEHPDSKLEGNPQTNPDGTTNPQAKPRAECYFCKVIDTGRNSEMDSMPAPTGIRRTFQCTTCEYICLSKSILRQHNIDAHDKEKPQCTICFLTFGAMKDLKKHVEGTHGKKSLRTCVLCNITFNERHEYNAHNASFHDGKKSISMSPMSCWLCRRASTKEPCCYCA